MRRHLPKSRFLIRLIYVERGGWIRGKIMQRPSVIIALLHVFVLIEIHAFMKDSLSPFLVPW